MFGKYYIDDYYRNENRFESELLDAISEKSFDLIDGSNFFNNEYYNTILSKLEAKYLSDIDYAAMILDRFVKLYKIGKPD